ncbi:MAG: hypothetical protein M1281_03520 [Chloroflexi bacterium]|nr:hypothetical protein [Chloroflexota bacterium]
MIQPLWNFIRARSIQGSSWKWLIGLLIAVLVFSYLGYRAFKGIQQLTQTSLHFQPGFLALSLACHWIGTGVAVVVWGDILRRLGVLSNTIFDFEAFCASAIARKIPGTVWYAVGRIAIYNLIDASKALVIIALVIEALMLSLAGLVDLSISVIYVNILPAWIDRRILFYVVLPVLVILAVVAAPAAIRYAIQRAQRRQKNGVKLTVPKITYRDSLRWLAGEAIVLVLATSVYYFLYKSIDTAHTHVPFTAMLGAFSLSTVVGPLAVWLPGDIGLRDGFLYLALTPFVDSSFAGLITIAGRIWISISEVFLGLVSAALLSRRYSLKLKNKPDRNQI